MLKTCDQIHVAYLGSLKKYHAIGKHPEKNYDSVTEGWVILLKLHLTPARIFTKLSIFEIALFYTRCTFITCKHYALL